MEPRRSTADHWLEPASWEDRRGMRRVDAAASAVLTRPNQFRSPVPLLDISTRGCRVRAGGLRAGDRVWLELDGLEPLCAHVAWTGPAESGLEFRQPLHPAVVDHLTGGSTADRRSAD